MWELQALQNGKAGSDAAACGWMICKAEQVQHGASIGYQADRVLAVFWVLRYAHSAGCAGLMDGCMDECSFQEDVRGVSMTLTLCIWHG